jgi:D-alanyl-D-alanine carboxypeptidase/D-alanyl-D-alanine-endopeptidase (penicillin-binding protein 4)
VLTARDRQVRALQSDLARIVAAPILRRGLVAVEAASLDRGDVLFRYNADRLLMPASNMKIVTLAAAAERLGWDYTFATTLHAAGPVVDGALRGDLVVRGSGDPSLNARQVSPVAAFDRWADLIAAAGIRRVNGRLVGDDNAFDEELFGQGWAWDYLQEGYAAPIGALQVFEDVVALSIAPGASAGDPAQVEIATPGSGWAVDNRAVTGAAGTANRLELRRRPGTLVVHATGSVPAGLQPSTRTLAVDNPTTYLLGLFAAALERRGITIGSGVADIDDLQPNSVATLGPAIVEHRSPPLREIARTMMTASENLYAETLLRAIGRVEGRPMSVADGRATALTVLEEWGMAPDTVLLADGSGLSRYNMLTVDAILTVLRRMHDDPRHRQAWMESLAVSGQPGTLQKRFIGTPAESRVRAKTGSIAYVRALSGYVESMGGETLAFSILINNVTAPVDEILKIIDAAVLRLAAFSRRS